MCECVLYVFCVFGWVCGMGGMNEMCLWIGLGLVGLVWFGLQFEEFFFVFFLALFIFLFIGIIATYGWMDKGMIGGTFCSLFLSFVGVRSCDIREVKIKKTEIK